MSTKAKGGRGAGNMFALRQAEGEVVVLPVDKLTPNTWNPNRQTEAEFELLKRSIIEDGFTQPVLVLRRQDAEGRYFIIDGEHRWRAARELGIPEVPVMFADMELQQAMVSTIRHNAARGTHDASLEASVLADIVADLGVEEAAERLHKSVDELSILQKAVDTGVGARAMEAVGNISEGRAEAAAAFMRAEEARLLEAEVENTFEVRLFWAGEEAKIVASVLSPDPRARLLELCRWSVGNG